MAVKVSAVHTGSTLLPRNIIIFLVSGIEYLIGMYVKGNCSPETDVYLEGLSKIKNMWNELRTLKLLAVNQ
jgi:hypothetical protein